MERKIIAKSLYNYYCVLLKTNCICTVAFFNHVNNIFFCQNLKPSTWSLTSLHDTNKPFLWIVHSGLALRFSLTLYINALFRLVDKMGTLYEFFVFFSLFPHRSDIFPCEFRVAWYLPKYGTGQIPHLRESPFLK